MPGRSIDDRLQYRHVQLLPKSKFQPIRVSLVTRTKTAPIRTQDTIGEAHEVEQLWEEAELHDHAYQEMATAVRTEQKKFPSRLGVKVSISKCSLSNEGKLEFRGRRWVPTSEPLRTKLIQETHDSMIGGHPGREVTAALMMRQFFWPNMLADVRRFVRNCDNC